MILFSKKYKLNEIDILAQQLYQQFEKDKVWIFVGDLGTGKTTFIQSLCRQMGIKDTVNSPSFGLIQTYTHAANCVYHIDLYRLKNLEAVLHIGIEEILNSGQYCFIEWGQIIAPLLKQIPHITLNFKMGKTSEERTLEIIKLHFEHPQ